MSLIGLQFVSFMFSGAVAGTLITEEEGVVGSLSQVRPWSDDVDPLVESLLSIWNFLAFRVWEIDDLFF